MNLKAELSAYDGRHTASLEALSIRLQPDQCVLDQLVSIAGSAEATLQSASTWLLKRFLENGIVFPLSLTNKCMTLLGRVTDWGARLHLLQMLPRISIPHDRGQALHSVLLRCLGDDNKLIRAWSYNGLFCLANQHPEFREEVADLLSVGRREEAASVKARIRNILKTSAWADTLI